MIPTPLLEICVLFNLFQNPKFSLFNVENKREIYINSISYTFNDEGTWNTEDSESRAPKYITAAIGYTIIHDETPNINTRFYGVNLCLKILLDKFISLVGLLITLPILAFFSFWIYLEDGFPILFTQYRTGWDGRRFKIFKLRSLKISNLDKTKQATQNDPRLLKIGKFLRRFSVDELPQLLNVFKGDMSIVGPRPHMVEHDIWYSTLFADFLKRHKTNPGITGWAQVNGFRGATPESDLMRKRMEHDLWYLNHWTIWLDIYIMIKTFYVIFKHKGD